MLALYLACLGFGLTVLVASLVLGGKDSDHEGGHGDGHADHDADHEVDHDADHEVDHDADHEVDHDADHDHGGEKGDLKLGGDWNPFLSVRFWTFGLFSFGLVGTLLTLAGLAWLLTLLSALLAGGALGWMAAAFFRMLNKDSVSGETALEQLAGEEARVLVAIRPGGRGKIAIDRMSGRVELPATTRDSAAIEAGQTVLVASVKDGVADVSRAAPSEAERRARRSQQARSAERSNV